MVSVNEKNFLTDMKMCKKEIHSSYAWSCIFYLLGCFFLGGGGGGGGLPRAIKSAFKKPYSTSHV